MNVALAMAATALLGAFYSWTSRLNALFFFSRSVGAELRESQAGRAISRSYRISVLEVTLACLGIAWMGAQHDRQLAAGGLLLEALACWAIFARANHQVRALQTDVYADRGREAVVSVPLLAGPSYWVPGVVMALLPVLLAAVGLLASVLFVGHGAPLGVSWKLWVEGIGAHRLDTMLGLCAGVLTSSTGALLVLRRSVRLRTRMAQYSVRASVVMQWIGMALALCVLGANCIGYTLTAHATKALVATAVVGAILVALWNQGRAKQFLPPAVEQGADDRWRWGLFYSDRQDPALFVQSRCGAGYTLNYGRVLAWPIALAAVAYFVTMLFLPMHL